MRLHLLPLFFVFLFAPHIFAQNEIQPTDIHSTVSDTSLMPLEVNTLYPEYLLYDTLTMNPTATNLSKLHNPFFHSSVWNVYPSWGMHRGLNLSLGTSIFASLGKNMYHHTGFSQQIDAIYAIPVSPKLTLAAGGYLRNIYWAHKNYQNAGLSLIAGYQINEHWELYLYGNKSLVKNNMVPALFYDFHELGDRIGAGVKYNFTPAFSVQVSVERSWNHTEFPTNPLFVNPNPYER